MQESVLSLHYVGLAASGFAHHAVWLILETWVNHCLPPFAERLCMGWGLPSIPTCIKVRDEWSMPSQVFSEHAHCHPTNRFPGIYGFQSSPWPSHPPVFLSSSSSPAAVSILGKCHTHSCSKLLNNNALVLGPLLTSKLWVKSNKVRP